MAEALVAAIAAAGTAVGGTAGATLIMGAEAIANAVLVVSAIGANAAVSGYQKRQAAARQRASYNASLEDREVTIRSAIAPRRMVLGRDRISGPIVYAESTGDKGQYLHMVIALAHGECEAIEEVWLGDVKLPEPDGAGFITSGEYASNTVTTHLHVATTAGTTLVLPQVASKVLAVSQDGGYVNADGQSATEVVTGWAHAAPSNTVTGLTPGTYYVNYETTASVPRVRIKKHLGGAGQVADADLVAESAGQWTAAHVGVGVCYIYIRYEYDQDVFGQVGLQDVKCVVRGGKAWDPRTGLMASSDNAALLAAKWLRDGEMGFGATSAQVPAAELGAEANICDEAVALDAGGTTQKRYTFNGSFTSDESPRDVLEDILSGMAGTAVWVQGRWLLRAGAYRTPAPALDEDALAGSGVTIVPRASRSDLFNAVRVTYRDPAQDWAEVQAPLVANAGYEAEDGGRQIVRDVTLSSAMDTWRAQRMAKIILERARQSTTVRLSTNLRGYDLAPTDTVPLKLARYGFDAKVFEVGSRTYDPLGTLQYHLVETAPGVWAWNYGEATVGDLAPNTSLPNPYARPAALTGLGVDAGPSYILRNRGGTMIARALVVWDAATEVFVVNGGHIEVQWKRTADTDWQDAPRVAGDQTSTILSPMPDGEAILVRVRAVNASGRASDWITEAENVVQLALYASASLIDATWWRPGAAWEWLQYVGTNASNAIVWGSGPHGESQALWQATAAAAGGVNGGWEQGSLGGARKNAFNVDTGASYRFALPVYMPLGDAGNWEFGPSFGGVVCTLNTSTGEADPRFWAGAVSAGWKGRWCLMVGYVFPAGSTGLTNAGSGIYDMETGALLSVGNNFCWAAGAAECGVRAFFTGAGAAGDVVRWAPPQVEVMDGYEAGRITYLGAKQVVTNHLADHSVTKGEIVDSSQAVGSSGSPGASVRVATMWGPTVATEAGDQLDINVVGLLEETFWSQAALASVDLWLTHAPTFGGTQTAFGVHRKFLSPVDVYTNPSQISLDMHGQIEPGAVTQDYVLRVAITYRDAAGAAKQCAKDFTADAQWRVVRRKR